MHASSPTDAIASGTRLRPTGFRHLWVFAVVAAVELVVATLAFDTPQSNLAYWQDPIVYAHALAKIAIVGFFLLIVAAWPRRAEMIEAYHSASTSSGAKPYFAFNIALFVALLAVRFAISQMSAPPVQLFTLYSFILLATGASLAFLAAPPGFWRRLPRLVPVEIAIALTGGLCVLGLGTVAQQGWTTLAGATLTLSHWFLTLYEPNVLLDSEKWLLGVGDFSVFIYGPCSGYEGVALILTFLSVYLWVFREELRFPNVLLMLPLGALAIWVLNALRIAVLVSLGAHISPEIALQGFHSQAGWISFLAVTLAAIAVSRKVPFFAASPSPRPLQSPPVAGPVADRTLAFLAPFMAMLAANIVASAFTPHEHWLYAVKVLAIGATLWWFRDVYRPLLAGLSWGSVPVGLAVGTLWIMTDPGLGRETSLGDWIASLPAWTAAAWLTLRAVGTVALVPVAEELAFRGFLARWLVSTRFESVDFGRFTPLAFVGSSLAFGLVHERWLAAFLAGAVYALLMYRTKRLSDPIVAHAVTNLAIVVWAGATRQWSLL